MTRPYSDDLRARVAAAVLRGLTVRAVAALFGISTSVAAKWSARLRAEGSAAAKPTEDVRRAVLAGKRDWLLARVAAVPDLTLREIQAELAELAELAARGRAASLWTVWRFYEAAGITFKKAMSSLQRFAKRLRADYGTMRAALSLNWSNGQMEGQINRLKTIKRQIYVPPVLTCWGAGHCLRHDHQPMLRLYAT